MTVDLNDPTLKKRIKSMTHEEKLEVVYAIIDRDAATWKEYNRTHWCDFGYYFSKIGGGLALTESLR